MIEDDVLAILKPEIDKTVAALSARKFDADPIAGGHFSRVVSVMSSAYKRHGYILERAILETLKHYDHFAVWKDDEFKVSQVADHIVDGCIGDPMQALATESPYGGEHRRLQVDILVYNKNTKQLSSYEVKRGAGLHDSGKRRSILRDLLAIQVLLKSYGIARGYDVLQAKSLIIFYYGKCSVPKPFCFTREELDAHFGVPIVGVVEAVNEYYKSQLFHILAG